MRESKCNHCLDCINCGRNREYYENERCLECGCELTDDEERKGHGLCSDCYKLIYCAECGDELAEYGENKTENGTLLCDVCYAELEEYKE